jgi:hypothetical protein
MGEVERGCIKNKGRSIAFSYPAAKSLATPFLPYKTREIGGRCIRNTMSF